MDKFAEGSYVGERGGSVCKEDMSTSDVREKKILSLRAEREGMSLSEPRRRKRSIPQVRRQTLSTTSTLPPGVYH